MNNELKELLIDVTERVKYLGELGVDSLAVKLREPSSIEDPGAAAKAAAQPSAPIQRANTEAAIIAESKIKPGSRLATLPTLSNRLAAKVNTSITAEPSASAIAPIFPSSVETVEQIRADIGNCVRCPLHLGRTQIVHSTGNFHADLMFVGEAPGADEDLQGFPFVGRAGKLLTGIIEAIGFKREEVFIGNINRCRPPGNRPPVPLETATCRPFLLREVAVVQPKVIVVLGNTATQNLLDINTPISKLRGRFRDYFGVKVMPTFHPAYLLRDPHKKREVWQDMKLVRDYLSSVP
ncbi:MAG: uracil-DNA glycosylase family protein [Pyrinomonadaceae bacterium]